MKAKLNNYERVINGLSPAAAKTKVGIGFYLLFSLYLILPDYFALEFSSVIPLLTVSRMILILVIWNYLRSNSWKLSMHLCKNHKIERVIILYVVGMIAVNIFNVRLTAESIKGVLAVMLEELAFVWIVTKLITSRERFMQAVRLLVYTSGIVAVIAIIGSIINYNLFYLLDTVQRTTLQGSSVRMGLVRAEAGFGHAVYYGVYCVTMIVLSTLLYEYDIRKRKALICIILNLAALIFANSRGSLVVLTIIFILIIFNKNAIIVKKYLKLIGIGIGCLIFISLCSPSIRKFIFDIFLSLIGIFDKAVSVEGYGANAEGMSSRLAQLSSLLFVWVHNPLFGFGKRAQVRNVVKCYWQGHWVPLNTIDMGVVATVVQYGYVGLILEMILFISMLGYVFKKRKDPFFRKLGILLISYLLGLLTVSGVNTVLWLIIALFVCYINICYSEKRKNI